jgi:hypothetical protein
LPGHLMKGHASNPLYHRLGENLRLAFGLWIPACESIRTIAPG